MTGTASGALDLGAPVRSTIVNSDDVAYVVTTDGVLHKVTVGSTGQPRELHASPSRTTPRRVLP